MRMHACIHTLHTHVLRQLFAHAVSTQTRCSAEASGFETKAAICAGQLAELAGAFELPQLWGGGRHLKKILRWVGHG